MPSMKEMAFVAAAFAAASLCFAGGEGAKPHYAGRYRQPLRLQTSPSAAASEQSAGSTPPL